MPVCLPHPLCCTIDCEGRCWHCRQCLAIRSSSPDANFGTKGEKIGWIREGEIVKALSVKQVSTVFGFEVWMEVRTSNGVRGWVLAGATAEVLKGNGGLAKLETMESSNLIAKANF